MLHIINLTKNISFNSIKNYFYILKSLIKSSYYYFYFFLFFIIVRFIIHLCVFIYFFLDNYFYAI